MVWHARLGRRRTPGYDGLRARSLMASCNGNRTRRSRIVTSPKKMTAPPTPYRQKLVRDVMDYFEKHAAVKFERIPNHTNFMTNADFSKEEIRQQVDLRIAFGVPTAAGCWGWTGKPGPMIRTAVFENQDPTLPGPRYTTVYLGGLPSDAEWEKKMPKKDLETAMRTIYHELGHVCGLQHEHQSPQSPTVDAKDKSFPRVVATLFDEKSIMLYAGRPYKADPKRLTERTLFPSLTDECLLSIMYPFNADENRTFSVAIQHMNFSDKARKLMLDVLEKAFAQFPTIDHPTILKLRAAIAKEINLRPRLARLEKPDPDPRLNINFES
ncbi:ZnMc domain-containing protein [Mycena indigotica]|uniref:ZnMc domain-containing protein n=1 Tax=Mycena indigotica TaxID=2126181 RepID=A0A8H6SNI5_9AGAR|nr:ZnMc domain-containing protein [Mycena indigotica]KAF7302115.1 ZnMc domain-containing protein [Mycena indigotica]